MTSTSLLSVKNLSIQLRHSKQLTKDLISNVSFNLKEGETLGIIGESGSGKSLTALAIMGLLPVRTGFLVHGEIFFAQHALHQMTEKQRRTYNGSGLSMVFQDALRALNPVFSVGAQIAESARLHLQLSRSEAHQTAIQMLEAVGIKQAHRRAHDFPHQFSGGQRQRILLATALVAKPKILIADEITAALDVRAQGEILRWLKDWQQQHGTSIIFITHHLNLLQRIAKKALVLYAGESVEQVDCKDLFKHPLHPYTQALLHSCIRLENPTQLQPISGEPVTAGNWPTGCRFHPRCKQAKKSCVTQTPITHLINAHHTVRCHLYSSPTPDSLQKY